jgi:hypothetical protein
VQGGWGAGCFRRSGGSGGKGAASVVLGDLSVRRGTGRRFPARDACGDPASPRHAVASRCSQHGKAIGTRPVRAATLCFCVSRALCSRCALSSAFFALCVHFR